MYKIHFVTETVKIRWCGMGGLISTVAHIYFLNTQPSEGNNILSCWIISFRWNKGTMALTEQRDDDWLQGVKQIEYYKFILLERDWKLMDFWSSLLEVILTHSMNTDTCIERSKTHRRQDLGSMDDGNLVTVAMPGQKKMSLSHYFVFSIPRWLEWIFVNISVHRAAGT